MSFLQNLFSGQQPQQQQQQQQQTQPPQGQQPTQPQSGVNLPTAGVTDPTNPTIPPQKDPLEQFKNLWENEQNPQQQQETQFSVYSQLDPKKVFESAGRANFTNVVTPELMQAAQQGGEAGVAAMVTAMNAVAQQVFAQSTLATTKLIDNALGKNRDHIIGELPKHITKNLVTNELRTSNPLFNNPAVSPVISALESQFVTKFPNASPSEITKMAQQYILNLGDLFSPKQQPATGPQDNKGQEDWEAFLN